MTDETTDPATPASNNAEDTPALRAFESSISELEGLVEKLESGDIPLEEALARFERGITLSRECQSMLQAAELRVDQLLGNDEHARVAPLDTEALSDSDDRA